MDLFDLQISSNEAFAIQWEAGSGSGLRAGLVKVKSGKSTLTPMVEETLLQVTPAQGVKYGIVVYKTNNGNGQYRIKITPTK